MSKIKPALSAEEWQALRFHDKQHDAVAFIEKGRVYLGGEYCGGTFYDEARLAVAALCLHGRLTWEMVDALRRAAAQIASQDGPGMSFAMSNDPMLLAALADLLESLLPPREP